VDSPDDPQAFRLRAVLYQRTGQTANALTDYAQAVRLSPDDAQLLDEVGFLSFSAGRLDDAEKYFRKAVKLNAKLARAWNHLGMVQIANKQNSLAIESLDAALKILPEFVDALINRGFAHYQLGEFESALRDYASALKADPKAANAFNNRGLVYFQQKKYDEAVGEFTRCIMLDPKEPKYYEHRRLAYQKLGMSAEAKSDEEKWKRMQQSRLAELEIYRNPSSPTGYLARGEIAMNDGDLKAALADFDRAVTVSPRTARAWFARANAYYQLGEYQKTVDDCTRALELAEHHSFWSLRGDSYLKLAKFDEAIADFDKAKRLDPLVAEAFLQKAEELESLGRTEEAGEFRDRAKLLMSDVKLSPNAN
ncbi:MAG TPA: tetratricopeptide repeat protein, partial [Planctomycetaceae bacterium]|nr:tetratricopeptide repeat protein [Planctomycetaceae bacterium]